MLFRVEESKDCTVETILKFFFRAPGSKDDHDLTFSSVAQ